MDFKEAVFHLDQSQHFPQPATLERMKKALEMLGHPEANQKFIHIAGTNGKGSTGAMILAGLKSSGYCVGSFTSPHLIDLTERIAIDKIPISRNDFGRIYGLIAGDKEIKKLELSYFERLTLIALLYFQEKTPDYIIWETGLGGKLDATNVVNPIIAVITPIGIDHERHLGTDPVSISKEKAAIIKKGTTVIVAPQTSNLEMIFSLKAEAERAKAIFAKQFLPVYMKIKGFEPTFIEIPLLDFRGALPLLGRHQGENALTALLVLRALGVKISAASFADTFWPGRLQYFAEYNLLIDGAHNIQAVEKFVGFFKETGFSANLIFSCAKDKDHCGMIYLLDGLFKKVYLPHGANKRLKTPEKLAQSFKKTCSEITPSLYDALQKSAKEGYLTVLLGSLYLVGECLALLRNKFDIKDLTY